MEAGRFSFDKKLSDQTYTWEDYMGDMVLQVIKRRNAKKISRRVLAYAAGVRESEVNDLENFKYEKVSLPSFVKILFALGIKLDSD